MNFIRESAYFGIVLSLAAYGIGCLIKKWLKNGVFNPLLISIILTITVISVAKIDYEVYYSSARILSWFLTPATVCLAVPLYEKLDILKSNLKAVLAGIASGVAASLLSVLGMSALFGFSHEEYATFLPKSVTTAIGMGISEELGGYPELTASVIIITGVLGYVLAPLICRITRITEPVAKGIAIGTSSHAIGTAKAMEMGEIEGAVSGLSIAVAGVLTVAGASIFGQFI